MVYCLELEPDALSREGRFEDEVGGHGAERSLGHPELECDVQVLVLRLQPHPRLRVARLGGRREQANSKHLAMKNKNSRVSVEKYERSIQKGAGLLGAGEGVNILLSWCTLSVRAQQIL